MVEGVGAERARCCVAPHSVCRTGVSFRLNRCASGSFPKKESYPIMSAEEENAAAYRRAVEAGIIVPVNNWWLSSTLEGAADRATAVEASGPEAVGRLGAREVLLAACDAVKERNAARQERDAARAERDAARAELERGGRGGHRLWAAEARRERDAARRELVALQKELDECKKELDICRRICEAAAMFDDVKQEMEERRKILKSDMMDEAREIVDAMPSTTDDNRKTRVKKLYKKLKRAAEFADEHANDSE